MVNFQSLVMALILFVLVLSAAAISQQEDKSDESMMARAQHKVTVERKAGSSEYFSVRRRFRKFSSLVRLVQKKYGPKLGMKAGATKARSLLSRSWEKLQELHRDYRQAAAGRLQRKASEARLQAAALPSDQHGRKVSMQEAVFLFTALNRPVQPKAVRFPLSEQEFVSLLASREAMVETAQDQVRKGKLASDAMRKNLMKEAEANQEETRSILHQHCKRGKSLHATSVGMALAQFELLEDEIQQKAMKRAQDNVDSMPPGGLQNLIEAMAERVKNETQALSHSATDRSEWFQRNYSPARLSHHPVV
mmetsp:Transcript_35514/g.80135  ORF Transcript_35514/g.80135 Transcript_35514/m.80135 type:complete len:307 (-) Transcript_35514:155-1075(-)